MSTGTTAVRHPDHTNVREPGDRHLLWRLAEVATPRQGWVSYGLLLGVLLTVGWLLTDAGWVQTPGLIWVLLISSLMGLFLARFSVPALFLHPIGLALGVIVVVWQMTSTMESTSLVDQVQELGRRLKDWYDAAASDEISTDLTPLSTAILSAGWLMGYLGSWFLFRSNNIWVALVLAGNAMVTVLSFLPANTEFTSRFFLFIFFAMLLMVRINSIQRHEAWERDHVSYRPNASWLTLHGAGWLSAVVLIGTAFLPMNAYVSRTVFDAWNNTGRAPFAFVEEEFTRLFSGLPSWKDLAGRFFGNTLPFQGSIAFSGDVVMLASSEIPTYWSSQTYSEYTSQGWKAGPTRKIVVEPDSLPVPQESMGRESVRQRVRLSFGSTDIMAGGNLERVSRKAILEVLDPMEFHISLLDSSRDAGLPEDVQAIAETLRVVLRDATTGFVESRISRQLPSDLVLMNVSYSKGSDADLRNVSRVTLARKEPITQEIVAWNFAKQTRPDQDYFMISAVSVATYDDLRKADTGYSGFITDHYLQLPPTLPPEVPELAAKVAGNGRTPVDKALAIQDFLRDPDNFEYTRNVEAPPLGADGVAHFLLTSRKGYSDYYASAMAVMLRSTGVPARLAGGYSAGLFHESGTMNIRDTDSHTWVQVYFPDFGWIDFEPTPKWAAFGRGLVGEDGGLLEGGLQGDREQPNARRDSVLDECLARQDILEEDCFEEGDDVGPEEQPGAGIRDLVTTWLPIAIGSVLGVVGILAVAIWTAWTLGLGSLNHVERIYTKMNRLGAVSGIRRGLDQTPVEYAAQMGNMVPAIASAAQSVSWAYAAGRYGRQAPSDQHLSELDEAWKGIRSGLLRRALRRMLPGKTR